MRINQYIAAASGLSRRAADTAVTDGRVKVNGHLATMGQIIQPSDQLTLDDALLQPRPVHAYILLHKPAGYVSSRARQGAAPTLYDLLPRTLHHLRPAGRLDRDSSGLMLLTDDGQLIHRLTHPSNGKIKRYELTLTKPLTPADRQHLARGVTLSDGPSRLTMVRSAGHSVTVTLSEGRNRHLRRTFGALGYGVKTLHRTTLGPYSLDQLAPGQWLQVEHPIGVAA